VIRAGALAAALAAAVPPPLAGAAPSLAPAAAPAAGPAGQGTATEYRTGAPIVATLRRDVTISPLRLVLASTPPLALPGDRVTIVLSVTNAGTAPIAGVIVSLGYASGSAYAGPLSGPVPPGPVTIPPTGTVSFTWTASVTAAGSVAVRAAVSGTVTGQGFVSASALRELTPPAVPRLSIRLDPNPATVVAGRWFDVVVTVSNTGGVRATDVLTAVSVESNAALVVRKAGPTPEKPARLEPGESARVTFTYSANGSGLVTFAATVTGRVDVSPPGAISRTANRLAAAARWTAAAARTAAARAAATWTRWMNPPIPPPPPERPFTSFETEQEAAWNTGGYARLALSSTRVTDGARSLEVEFLLASDLTRSPTGPFRPSLRVDAPARGATRALAPRDWSPFVSLRADVYSAAAAPLPLTFRLTDHRGYRHEQTRVLAPLSATTLEFPLAAARNDRVDLSRLATLELAADTSGHAVRPIVYLDHLRFALPPPPPAASTALTDSTASRTATGGLPRPAP
jgi:hypothetical protein